MICSSLHIHLIETKSGIHKEIVCFNRMCGYGPATSLKLGEIGSFMDREISNVSSLPLWAKLLFYTITICIQQNSTFLQSIKR